MNEIENLVDESGMITTKDVARSNQSKADFYNYLKKNNFEQISRGIYASQDSWVDPLLIAHMRCPKAVISHDVALHYYGLVDREPSSPTLMLRHNAASTMVKNEVPVSTIAAILGHADIDSTDIYITTDEKKLRECVLPMTGISKEVFS